MKRILLVALLGGSVLAAASAFAGEAYLVANATLRAGPDPGYPGVVRLHAGTRVGIEGCVDGWSWCDVVTGEDRGWIPANYLQEEYQGRRVFVPDYGVQIGIPVVTFVFGNYWDSYYRGRPWYGHREHWSHVHPSYYHSGSYAHAGGTYGHASGSYGHGSGDSSTWHSSSAYRDTHQVQSTPRPAYSTDHHSYDRTSRSSVVTTTQPAYQSGHTRATYQGTSTHGTASRRDVTAEAGAQHNHAYRVPASERNANPPRSASGEQHSAAGQARAAEVHDRNLARAQQKTQTERHQQAPKAAHKDAQSENDHGGGKDKKDQNRH